MVQPVSGGFPLRPIDRTHCDLEYETLGGVWILLTRMHGSSHGLIRLHFSSYLPYTLSGSDTVISHTSWYLVFGSEDKVASAYIGAATIWREMVEYSSLTGEEDVFEAALVVRSYETKPFHR